ncbi:MAG: hypothetical protein JXJ04_00260 [Spirochaetales bacterium]|nr:hypothetical protein [Spirochaetales bacterium]
MLNIELEVDGTLPTPVPAQEYSVAGAVDITESVRIRLSGDVNNDGFVDIIDALLVEPQSLFGLREIMTFS